MPTYEYHCQACGPFEKFQGIHDKKITVCPKCDGSVVRLIGAGCGVIFRGKGFPGNDSKKAREQ